MSNPVTLKDVFDRLEDYAPGEFLFTTEKIETNSWRREESTAYRLDCKGDDEIVISLGHHGRISSCVVLSRPYGLRSTSGKRLVRYSRFQLWKEDGYFEVPKLVAAAREAVSLNKEGREKRRQKQAEKKLREAKVVSLKDIFLTELKGRGLTPTFSRYGSDIEVGKASFSVRETGLDCGIASYQGKLSPKDAASLAAFLGALPSLKEAPNGNEEAA